MQKLTDLFTAQVLNLSNPVILPAVGSGIGKTIPMFVVNNSFLFLTTPGDTQYMKKYRYIKNNYFDIFKKYHC